VAVHEAEGSCSAADSCLLMRHVQLLALARLCAWVVQIRSLHVPDSGRVYDSSVRWRRIAQNMVIPCGKSAAECKRSWHAVHSRTEGVVAALVVLNMVVMALYYYGMPSALSSALDAVSNVILAVFVAEMVLKHAALGVRKYWSELTNAVDGVVALSSLAVVVVSAVDPRVHVVGQVTIAAAAVPGRRGALTRSRIRLLCCCVGADRSTAACWPPVAHRASLPTASNSLRDPCAVAAVHGQRHRASAACPLRCNRRGHGDVR
jgi:hypothetical protein